MHSYMDKTNLAGQDSTWSSTETGVLQAHQYKMKDIHTIGNIHSQQPAVLLGIQQVHVPEKNKKLFYYTND